jgi:hypothetical protein
MLRRKSTEGNGLPKFGLVHFEVLIHTWLQSGVNEKTSHFKLGQAPECFQETLCARGNKPCSFRRLFLEAQKIGDAFRYACCLTVVFRCLAEVEMITPPKGAAIAGVSSRIIYRWIEPLSAARPRQPGLAFKVGSFFPSLAPL